MKTLVIVVAFLVGGCAGGPSEFSPPYIASGNVGIARVHATTGLISNFGRLKNVVVEEVADKSPAQQAGLSAGDKIIRIDRWKVVDLTFTRFMALLESLEERKPGEKIVFEVVSPSSPGSREISVIVGERPQKPNKAPEPTLGAVTPRAADRVSDRKQKYVARNVARGAPAPVVAHL